MTLGGCDALYDEARNEPAFSNSDEGLGWMENWCGRCIHDKAQRAETPTGPGCPLVMVALMGRRPIQWLDGPRDEHGRYSIADQYHCVEYRHEDDGPAEPQPIPDPPGQLTLAPRTDYEGVRMLTQPAPEAVTA
ncbi:hypothetical protein [Streptomyces angustmyceticus]|uniref:hypothetical protein n=1 Tax=Streptomyces angustmyceticus TaxID=285578 RepID=UPI00344B70E1